VVHKEEEVVLRDTSNLKEIEHAQDRVEYKVIDPPPDLSAKDLVGKWV